MCPARILVADDHDLVRRGVRSLIHEQAEWELVAEATNGRDAVAWASKFKPDIAILDISMPSLNGLDATKEIMKLNPCAKILILTMHDSEQAIKHAINSGARGYVLKADVGSDMVRAVRALLNGQTFFTQKATRIILDGFTGKRPRGTERDPQALTAIQRQILRFLAEGKTVKEIAPLLSLSIKTVKTQRAELMRTFNGRIGELVRYAVRNHLLEA